MITAGTILYCTTGETVVVKKVDYTLKSLIVEYKGKEHKRDLDIIGNKLFLNKADINKTTSKPLHKFIEVPMFKDVSIDCSCCGKTFVFTEKEQIFYLENKLSAPKKCKECRD